MSAYLILDIDVRDPETYKEYVAAAPRFVEQYGGTYRVRGGDPENVEGDWQPSRIVVLEFPDRRAAHALLADPGYRKVGALRWGSAVSRAIVVDACGPIV